MRWNREGDPFSSLVAVDPATGEIRAMVGGRDFASQQFNVAVQGHRQPGSSFKPFVLVTALSDGVSPEQTFESGPRSFRLPNGQTSEGHRRLRRSQRSNALAGGHREVSELRLRSPRTGSGADATAKTAQRLGITTDITPVPAIALGGLEEGSRLWRWPRHMARSPTAACAYRHMPSFR